MNSTDFMAASIGGLPAVAAAWFAYRASVRATNVAATKVDAEAYVRSKAFYESLLTEADKHLERLRGQVDRMTGQVDRLNLQLAQEQDVSNVLRRQIAALTTQMGGLEDTLTDIRRQMGGRLLEGQRKAPNAARD